MSRFSFKAPAPSYQVSLSVEEEAIASDELNGNVIELDKESADIDRLGDIVVSMGDVQTVISNTPEVSTIDKELVFAMGDMAVAGTDASADNIVGQALLDQSMSTESFIGGVKDKLSKMWQTIKEFIAKMWQHVKNFFTSQSKDAKILKAATEELDEDLKRLKERGFSSQADLDKWMRDNDAFFRQDPPDFNFPLRLTRNLVIKGRMVDPKQLTGELEKLRKYGMGAMEAIAHAGAEGLNAMIDVVKHCINDPANAAKITDEAADQYNGIFDKLAERLAIGRGDTASPVFLGNFKIKMDLPATSALERRLLRARKPEFEINYEGDTHTEVRALEIGEIISANVPIAAWADFASHATVKSSIEEMSRLSDMLSSEITKLDDVRRKFIHERDEQAESRMKSTDEAEQLGALFGGIQSNIAHDAMMSLAYEARDLAKMGSITFTHISDSLNRIFKNAGRWNTMSCDHWDLVSKVEKDNEKTLEQQRKSGYK